MKNPKITWTIWGYPHFKKPQIVEYMLFQFIAYWVSRPLGCPLDSLLNTWYQCGILKRAIPKSHHRFQYEFMVIHDFDDLGVTHFRNPPCNNWYGLVFSSVFYSLAVCIHLGWSRYIWTKQLCTPQASYQKWVVSPKWMVYNENPMDMDDLVVPHFRTSPFGSKSHLSGSDMTSMTQNLPRFIACVPFKQSCTQLPCQESDRGIFFTRHTSKQSRLF